jgi:iron complex outermembrane receptor protein
LGATVSSATCSVTAGVGAPSISNSVSYNDMLPSLDVHYQLHSNWAVYGQYAEGDAIPDTGVFDVKNAQVASTPKPTKSKTFQAGSVWKSDKYTLDVDVYHTKLDNAYTVGTDPVSLLPTYPLVGNQISQGIEAESNIMLSGGFSLYVNGTYGSTKYSGGTNDSKWVSGAPADTETLGLNYTKAEWNTGLQIKRVGKMYNDNKTVNEAFTIDPTMLTNLFVNYTIKNPSNFTKQAKIQLAVNNLLNSHNIVGVAAGGTAGSTSATPTPADLLTVLPARSLSLTLKLDF